MPVSSGHSSRAPSPVVRLRGEARMSGFFAVSEVVARALAERRPVVALETTLVTHGLPPPEGVEVALELEREVATRGAVPATIGVLDGKIRVGLERAELERLAAGGGVAGSTGMPSGPKRA